MATHNQTEWLFCCKDGTKYSLPKIGIISLGQHGSDIVLKTRGVDKRHALIIHDSLEKCFKIKDLGSLLGTYLNGKKLTSYKYFSLRQDDCITFGKDSEPYWLTGMNSSDSLDPDYEPGFVRRKSFGNLQQISATGSSTSNPFASQLQREHLRPLRSCDSSPLLGHRRTVFLGNPAATAPITTMSSTGESSPPPSCPSNANNPPNNPHLAHLFYGPGSTTTTMHPVGGSTANQCVSPTLQQGFYFPNSTPNPTPTQHVVYQSNAPPPHHIYHQSQHAPALIHCQCDSCLSMVQHSLPPAQIIHYPPQTHANPHHGYFYSPHHQRMQYVAPRSLSVYMPPTQQQVTAALDHHATSMTGPGALPVSTMTPTQAYPTQQQQHRQQSVPSGTPTAAFPPGPPLSMPPMTGPPSSRQSQTASPDLHNRLSARSSSQAASSGRSSPINPYQTTEAPDLMPKTVDSDHQNSSILSNPPSDPYFNEYDSAAVAISSCGGAKVSEIRDDDDSDANNQQRYHLGAKMEKDKGRTPLFGSQPAWWGEEEKHAHNAEMAEVIKSANMRREPAEKPYSGPGSPDMKQDDSNGVRLRRSSPPPENLKNRQSICMEIAFDDLEVKESPRRKQPPSVNRVSSSSHHEPTAFTITFNDDKSTKITDLDKEGQSKKLKQNEVTERLIQKQKMRRSLRKYAGPGSDQVPEPQEQKRDAPVKVQQEIPAPDLGNKNAKKYLLGKMLQVKEDCRNGEEPTLDLPSPTIEDSVEVNSEAGTYVVDEEEPEEHNSASLQARDAIDKVFGVTGSADLSSEDGEGVEEGSKTPSPEPTREDNEPPPVIVPSHQYRPSVQNRRIIEGYQRRAHSAHRASAPPERPPPMKVLPQNRAAVTRPAKPIAMPGITRSAALRAAAAKASMEESSKINYASQMLGKEGRRSQSFVRTTTTRRSMVTTRLTPQPSGSPPSLSRYDGGRYSMRGNTEPAPVVNDRRVSGVAPAAKSRSVSASSTKDTPEMAAWLRRKKYNPMKAAAEDKQKRRQECVEATSEIPPHLSKRSASFHSGVTVNTTKLSMIETEITEETELPVDSAAVAEFSKSLSAKINQLSTPRQSQDDVEDLEDKDLDQEECLSARTAVETPSSDSDGASLKHLERLSQDLAKMANYTLFNLRNYQEDLSSSPKPISSLRSSQTDESSGQTAIDRITAQLEATKEALSAVNDHVLHHSSASSPEVLNHTGDPITRSDETHSSEQSDQGDTSFRLQETLNSLKPYWERRSSQSGVSAPKLERI